MHHDFFFSLCALLFIAPNSIFIPLSYRHHLPHLTLPDPRLLPLTLDTSFPVQSDILTRTHTTHSIRFRLNVLTACSLDSICPSRFSHLINHLAHSPTLHASATLRHPSDTLALTLDTRFGFVIVSFISRTHGSERASTPVHN